MHRIDHATREIDGNGTGKDGFTEGSPGVTPATVVTADILNALQEEVCGVITGAGIALEKNDNEQLVAAIEKHVYRTPILRSIMVPATRFFPFSPDPVHNTHEFNAGTGQLRLKASGPVGCDLAGLIPHGATQVTFALVLNAGSHLSPGKLYYVEKIVSPDPSVSPGLVVDIDQTSGTGLQTLTDPGSTVASWFGDLNTHSLVYDPVSLDSGNYDYIEGLQITFFDPGPRNY